MKLLLTFTSPFARKVRIAAYELSLADRVELVEVDPWREGPLRALNPLGKVPVLVRDDGEAVWESGLICERLAAMVGDDALFPPDGPPRWRALALQALTDGASTAAGRLFADERRDAAERSEAVMDRQRRAIDAVLDHLEGLSLMQAPSIGEVSTAALLGYLDFRWPQRDWRTQRPRLTQWFDLFSQRRSMRDTQHRLPA